MLMSPKLELVDDDGPLKLSASQVAKISECEMRWLLGKQSPRVDEPRPTYFMLGDLVHSGLQAWGTGKLVEPALYDKLRELDPHWDEEWEPPAWFAKGLGIMRQWELLNGPPQNVLMGVEVPFDVEIPGTKGVRVRGFFDGIRVVPSEDGIRTHDSYRVEEYKTMARWGRETYVPWAIDTWLYIWAARQQFPNVTGLNFQAVSTYDYKPTGKPEADAAKRFKSIQVDYDQNHVDRMLDDLRRIARRAQEILRSPKRAIRNIGERCARCEFRQQCLTPWDEWEEVR